MTLWQLWLPPIEKPENIRVVGKPFRTSEAKRRAGRTYYARHREKLAAAERERYWARKNGE